MHCREDAGGTRHSASRARESRPGRTPGAGTEKPPGSPAHAGTGPARFERPPLHPPSAELPGPSPNFPGKGSPPATPAAHSPGPLFAPGSGGASSRAPRPSAGPGSATRDHARPREPPAPAPAPYVGDVPGEAGPWGISRRRRPLSGAGGSGRRAPPPGPGRHRAALQRRAAANGRRGGGPAGGCHPAADGSAEPGSARATASRVLGEEPWLEEEEEPPSSRPRTTARPSCGGPTPAPRLPPLVPDRQHDRRAAPGLLLHRAEG